MCSVAQVSCQPMKGSAGHARSDVSVAVFSVEVMGNSIDQVVKDYRAQAPPETKNAAPKGGVFQN